MPTGVQVSLSDSLRLHVFLYIYNMCMYVCTYVCPVHACDWDLYVHKQERMCVCVRRELYLVHDLKAVAFQG